MIIEREIHLAIKSFVTKYPILALTGPRQSGKTTLLKTLFPEYLYVSLENPDNREFAVTDPNGFLKLYNEHVIFDEIQRVPALFSYLQTKIDESRKMGRFIISGSQNFHLMQQISQSMAGRVAIFRLFPLDFQEMHKGNLLDKDAMKNLVRGFYPALYDRDIPSGNYYNNYIQTYVQRDVSELIAIKDLHSFQTFIGICATRAGQILNLNSISKECGISQPTAKTWLSALENSYILFRLQPYYKNFSKRIIKSPKLYFYDTGLLAHLLKIRNHEKLYTHSAKGHLFENMIIADYVKRMNHLNKMQDIWFWRDSFGHEIDLYIEKEKQNYIVEIKAGMTIMPDAFKQLNWFTENSGLTDLRKQVVYSGTQYQQRSYGDVIPWSNFGKEV